MPCRTEYTVVVRRPLLSGVPVSSLHDAPRDARVDVEGTRFQRSGQVVWQIGLSAFLVMLICGPWRPVIGR